MLDGVDIGTVAKGSTVRLHTVLIAGAVGLDSATAHDGLTDDEGRPLALGNGTVERLANLGHVITIDFYDIPVPGAVFGCCVLIHNILGLRGELDVVGIIEHNQVVKT